MYQILSVAFVLFLTTSCKSEAQNQKEQQINTSISEMKTEMDSIQKAKKQDIQNNQTAKEQDIQNNQADKIIGVWEVKNDYYMAIYEVEKYKGKYIGKIHYYNDGKTEYKGENSEKDYFLGGVTYENGSYKNGKMYMPDGSNYQVVFNLKNNNELEVKMTVQGSPYTEIWKRQTQKKSTNE